MYLSFYGLREMPFHITPDPKFLYLSPSHREALQHLRYGVAERKGFIVLAGEVGCGKTTLCRMFLSELDPARYDTALILNPRINETGLLRTLLEELGEKPKGRGRADWMAQVNQVLLSRIEAGREILLIIDEAQNLTFEVLELVRLLSNFETDTQKLLQIILIGQPELKERLAAEELRQLRQRILVFCELTPLSLTELHDYVRHRLTLAGANGRPRFTPWALRSIHRISRGIPRIVNNLCDKALLSAYVRGSDEVGWWDVRRARREVLLAD
jgi:general secretion pathway protein A